MPIRKIVSAILIVIMVMVVVKGFMPVKPQTKTVLFQHQDSVRISDYIADLCNDPDIRLLSSPEVTEQAGLTWVTIRYVEK